MMILPHIMISSNAERSIYWKTCITMILALISGFLFALGHHLYYSNLASTPVPDGNHRALGGLSKQQANLTVGNLFAFLVKASFAVSVSAAYTQVAWRTVKRQHNTLSVLDAVFSAVNNIAPLVRISVWWKYQMLLLIVLISWYNSSKQFANHAPSKRLLCIK